MSTDIIKSVLLILLLLTAQVTILNNIHLFGCATPLLLVYAIITLSSNTPRWVSLLTGFSLGLLSDTFSNTPGVSASSLTLIAFVQPKLLKLFISRDTPDSISPSIRSLGPAKFTSFSLILTLLHCTMVYTLEQFSFFHWQQWLLNICGSSILTYMFILTMESIRKN